MVFGFATLSLVTASLASMLVIEEEEEPDLEAARITEAEVLAELKEVRGRLESLEQRLARRG